MKAIYFTALILTVLLLANCKKNSSPTIDVSRITSTDVVGNTTSTIDETDWTFDGNWTNEETLLFQTPTATQLANTASGTITMSPGYPNPLTELQSVFIRSTTKAVMEIVVTDNMLNVKKRNFSDILPGSINILSLYDQSIFENNRNYRVYYAFYSLTDGIFYKGHGDIKISR